MIRRAGFAFTAMLIFAMPLSAKTWKTTKKVDPAASKAALRAMNKCLSGAVISRAKDGKDTKNAFATKGESSLTGSSKLRGEWSFELALDGKKKSKERPLNIALSSDGLTLSADYLTLDYDFAYPVVWGICGPKVNANAALTGSITVAKSKAIPDVYLNAGCDGQIGCGVVVKGCAVAWIGGGIYADGQIGVKPCKSGACMNGYRSGEFGPNFTIKTACRTMFSWKDDWKSKEVVLSTEYY
jgi:hypothetical protein